ncbi:hypothetical protein ACFXKJ_26180 [Kitasatospora indigofera]|uniref:Uncharacterized protein n=1 Tax=Kitasatospora indigofera TaxID=67307 RepID=A0A919KX45_9ACTN|nr:hypothetical protein [Kitasatospora indigofera]GHH75972.1 hypothetical protein GCM10018781_46130 [Kitasatospora indigofera]
MLGEQLGEQQSRETAKRVLPGGDVEVSYEAEGELLGVATTEIATYESTMDAHGVLVGEGQGVTMTADGDVVVWHGNGIGRFTGTAPGAMSWRGAIFFDTSSERFARLNSAVGVFEYDTDGSGKGTAKFWEWK